MHQPSAFEFEWDIERLKRHKPPGIYRIPAELIKAGGRAIHPEIYKLIHSVWTKEEFTEQCKQ